MTNHFNRMHLLRFASFVAFFVLFVAKVSADPVTKQLEIDFGRDVASRNLKGLVTRSDGRVLMRHRVVEAVGCP